MKRVLVAIGILAFAPYQVAIGGIFDSVTDVVGKATRDVKAVTRPVTDRIERSESLPEIKLEAAAALEATRAEYEKKLLELAEQGQQIEREMESLIKEKAILAVEHKKLADEKNIIAMDKADVERREQFYATGFYGSLGAIFIGCLGFVFRRPLIRLEMRLKEIEIEEKTLSLAEARRRQNSYDDTE